LGRRALRVFKEFKVFRAKLVPKDQLDHKEHRAHKVFKVQKVKLVRKDHKVLLVQPELQVTQLVEQLLISRSERQLPHPQAQKLL
jgi:hypothetical protein